MEPWDAELIRRQGTGTLVQIARQGRLVLNGVEGARRVDLSWVDEAALALVQAALERRKTLHLVYPAPAGQVSVLLAAQILVHELIQHRDSPSVGLLTNDPGAAIRLWDQISIRRGSERVAISSVFRGYRAGANGASPFGRDRFFKGLLAGRACSSWPVNTTIVDELAGPVAGEPRGSTIRVYADPFDSRLERAVANGDLLWGWSESILRLWNEELEHARADTVPFSVAHSRLETISRGVDLTVCVCHNESAEKALLRLRQDLGELARAVGPRPPRHLELGLRVAWSHASALSSLPCEPSWYDRFAGVPPRAARATSEFERELSAWSRTLDGRLREYSSAVASDLADLRAALETKGNPSLPVLKRTAASKTPTLAVLRTKTAARALLSRLGADPGGESVGALRVAWLGQLHRLPACEEAIVTGAPPRSAWHRIDSGIARDVRILVLGDDESKRAKWAIGELKVARQKWGGLSIRAATWKALVGGPPPPPPLDVPYVPSIIRDSLGPTVGMESDPFSPLGSLFDDDRPLLEDEGSSEHVARADDSGIWNATVRAVEVRTDLGLLLLPEDEEVDVLSEDEPITLCASALTPGMRVVVGRQSGRIGLLEALEDKLKHRPDLLAARMLVKDYQERVHAAFATSGHNFSPLYARLKARGCEKLEVTIKAWVTRGGPMGPRDEVDLIALIAALRLELPDGRAREIFAALGRIRTFRRAAGRALARAATEAALSYEDAKVDPTTGLSLADLRDAVVIVKVQSVRKLDSPVRLADTGRLEGYAR